MKITQKSLTMKRWVLFTTYGWFMGILVIIGLALLAEALINTTEESGGQAIVEAAVQTESAAAFGARFTR